MQLVRDLMARDNLAVSRARSNIYSRVSHYSRRGDEEDYHVDLEGTRFSAMMNGFVLTSGRLQVVGTLHNNQFLWSWHNSSIPPQAYSEVKEFCENEKRLSPLMQGQTFDCDLEFADYLSQWIAVKLGWLGAFEAPNAQAIAMLILDLAPTDTFIVPVKGELKWCTFCGMDQDYFSSTDSVTWSPTCLICQECAELFKEISSVSTPSKGTNLDTEVDGNLTSCLLCGLKRKRIFARNGAICYKCLADPKFGSPSPVSAETTINRPVEAKKQLHCSFCAKRKEDVPNFISSKDANICSECISVCNRCLSDPAYQGITEKTWVCSFCGKPRGSVSTLVKLPDSCFNYWICNECVELCNEIIDEAVPQPGKER